MVHRVSSVRPLTCCVASKIEKHSCKMPHKMFIYKPSGVAKFHTKTAFKPKKNRLTIEALQTIKIFGSRKNETWIVISWYCQLKDSTMLSKLFSSHYICYCLVGRWTLFGSEWLSNAERLWFLLAPSSQTVRHCYHLFLSDTVKSATQLPYQMMKASALIVSKLC